MGSGGSDVPNDRYPSSIASRLIFGGLVPSDTRKRWQQESSAQFGISLSGVQKPRRRQPHITSSPPNGPHSRALAAYVGELNKPPDYFASCHQHIDILLNTLPQFDNQSSSVSIDQDQTCAKHRNPRFVDFFKGGPDEFDLGSLVDILGNRHCSLCRLVRETLCTFSRGSLRGGPTTCSAIMIECSFYEENQYDPPEYFKLYDKHKRWCNHLLLDGHPQKDIQGPLHGFRLVTNPPKDILPPPFTSRRVNPLADMEIVQQWIKTCDHWHSETCGKYPRPNITQSRGLLRLIDVNRRKITTHFSRMPVKYVALSYVWGPNPDREFMSTIDKFTREEEPSLGTDIPETIEDAMAVVRQLCISYLWVDSLCILQDSPDDKKKLIPQMSHIYASAYLTIVAVDGESMHMHTPGSPSNPRRAYQRIGHIDGRDFACALPSSQEAIASSKWATRAWTYQERLLSARCLFFTKYQVYYQCHQEIWCEDVWEENCFPAMSPVNHDVRNKHARLQKLRYSPTRSFEEAFKAFAKSLETYTSRNDLTFEEDILNAFSGAMDFIKTECSVDFAHGLTLERLDCALLWQPLRRPRPREFSSDSEAVFPTWSWTAWKGQVGYDSTFSGPEETRSKIYWPTNEGEIAFQPVEGESLPEYYFEIGSATSSHVLNPHPEKAVLRFWTSSAKFKIEKSNFWDLEARPSIASEDPTFLYAKILDQHGTPAGEILIDQDVLCSQQSNYEFIVVSQATSSDRHVWNSGWGGEKGEKMIIENPWSAPQEVIEAKDEYWSQFRVMLIERGRYCSRRVAIGTIHVEAWKANKPVWTFIELG